MKRLFSFMMALVLVLSLGVTAFAEEETGSITVDNATFGETYSVYKIFDASIKYKTDDKGELVLENGKPIADGVAYTIAENSQFFTSLFKANSTEQDPYKNDFFHYNPNTGSVTKKDGVNDSELIKYLTNLVTTGTFQTAAKSILAVEEGKTHTDYTLKYTFDSEKHTTDVGPEITFDNLTYGYYLITSTLGATVTINSNTPDVNVIDKNQIPGQNFDKQVQNGEDENKNPVWSDGNSANIGDQITYKISFTATNYDKDKLIKYYQVHDTKGDAIWAEFNSFKVVVDGVELPRGYYLKNKGAVNTGGWGYLNEDSNHPDSWKNVEKTRDNAQWYLVHLGYDEYRITIPWLTNHHINEVVDGSGEVVSYSLSFGENAVSKYNSPSEVVITYTAVVEANAAIGPDSHGNRFNKANASWTSEHETGTTTPDEVVTEVFGLGLLKDDSSNGQNLAGAKFRIYRDKACTIPVYVIPTDVKGIYIMDSLNTPLDKVTGTGRQTTRDTFKDKVDLDAYLKDDEGNPVLQNNLVVSQVNGKLAVLGLKEGTYYLKEVEAPDGYNALSQPVELTIDGDSNRPFNIFVDTNGNVADIQETDGIYTEKIMSLTHTVVHNSKGVELPSTGGEGTMMMITIGTMIAMAFAVLLITHKKMSIYHD